MRGTMSPPSCFASQPPRQDVLLVVPALRPLLFGCSEPEISPRRGLGAIDEGHAEHLPRMALVQAVLRLLHDDRAVLVRAPRHPFELANHISCAMFWTLPIYVSPSERASERRDGGDEIVCDLGTCGRNEECESQRSYERGYKKFVQAAVMPLTSIYNIFMISI